MEQKESIKEKKKEKNAIIITGRLPSKTNHHQEAIVSILAEEAE